jgi:hypothetical protein
MNLTPCRPTKPQTLCASCHRKTLPVLHSRGDGRGAIVWHVVMDPTAVIGDRGCELWEPCVELEAA